MFLRLNRLALLYEGLAVQAHTLTASRTRTTASPVALVARPTGVATRSGTWMASPTAVAPAAEAHPEVRNTAEERSAVTEEDCCHRGRAEARTLDG